MSWKVCPWTSAWLLLERGQQLPSSVWPHLLLPHAQDARRHQRSLSLLATSSGYHPGQSWPSEGRSLLGHIWFCPKHCSDSRAWLTFSVCDSGVKPKCHRGSPSRWLVALEDISPRLITCFSTTDAFSEAHIPDLRTGRCRAGAALRPGYHPGFRLNKPGSRTRSQGHPPVGHLRGKSPQN